MSKSKKILFSLLITAVIAFCAAYWVVEKIITAHISKAAITQKLEAVTGYHVLISGELQWHYSLQPSLDLDKITFSSQTNEIICVKNARISMALIPLLQELFAVDISFQDWQQNQLHFSKGQAHIEFKNDILHLTHFQSEFYQGHLVGEAQVDLKSPVPQFTITLNATQVEMAKLLADITQTASVSGEMNVSATLNSHGENAAEFIGYLNGKISALIQNGKLNTIRLEQMLPALSTASKNRDVFDTLNIDALLTNGIANTTLNLLAKNYRLQGAGTINLVKQSLNLQIDSYYTRSIKTKSVAIPVNITGPIASPTITVDITQPLNQLLKTDGRSFANKIKNLLG